MANLNINIRKATNRVMRSRELDDRMFLAAKKAQEQAALLCRYDTGRLRDSIQATTRRSKTMLGSNAESGDGIEAPGKNGEAHIGTNVIYAAVHEFGYPERNITRQSYLRLGLHSSRHDIKRLLG